MSAASFILPGVFAILGFVIAFSKKDTSSMFLSGCKDGINTAFGILPSLIMLVVAVRMFSASGALEALCGVSAPLCRFMGIPSEMLPVVIMRPISGSGALASAKELFEAHGADSFAGRAASVLMGSSDTILYTLSVYFSHTGTKKTGYALPASFVVMLFCVVISCAVCRYIFIP